jgi:AraC family transcriptional regulator
MFPQRKETFATFSLEGVVVPPGTRLPSHQHERAHLLMVYAGEVLDQSAQESHWVRPGELLLRPAGIRHANRVGAGGAQLIFIDMMPSLAEAFQPFYGQAWASARLTFAMLRHLPDQLRTEMASLDRISRRILPGLVEQLLGIGARAIGGSADPAWLRQAVALLDGSFAEGIEVAEVARRIGVSPSRLSHVFRAQFGRSIGGYLRGLRVEAAAQALRETDDSIAAIAADCGFADQAHLSRTFRAERATTPMVYRRQHREAR